MKAKLIKTKYQEHMLFCESEINEQSTREHVNTLIIDDQTRFQEIIGFGGAFTEAAAYTLSRMTKEQQQEIMESYFHPEKGIGYTMGRIAMNSCDFALENYSYVQDNDMTLESFDISHEEKWVFPMIQTASEMLNQPIGLLVSPWSPPAYMKTNGEMNNGGKLKPEFAALWAKYNARFIKACQEKGLSIWALSIQNEPEAIQIWDSCIYTGEEERDFIKNHLGPELEIQQLTDIKVIIWDHNRDIIVERAQAVLNDPEAAKYVWGTGIHWYVSEAFENVGKVHELFPDKHLFFTEGCQEGGLHLGSITTGERYVRNILGDINNYCEGFLDWNMVLDETGGPNHVGNYCDAPIIANTKTNLVFKNSSYYYIGHISKYVQPGAVRILSQWTQDNLISCCFKNTDGTLVVIVMNDSDQKTDFNCRHNENSFFVNIDEHSIITLIIYA